MANLLTYEQDCFGLPTGIHTHASPSYKPRHQQRSNDRASKNLTARFTGPFRFFGLPRELRDMVYDAVWPSIPPLRRVTEMCKPSPLIDITAQYRNPSGGVSPGLHIPCYFLVNSAFLREAMEQYFRCIDWTAMIPMSYFTTRMFLGNLSTQKSAFTKMREEMNALSAGCKYLEWIPDATYSRTVIELYKAWPINLPILKKLERGLYRNNGKRTLCISLGVILHRAKGNIGVNLSRLEHIGFNLDTLLVDIICVDFHSRTRAPDLLPLIQMEIDRLEHVLIGQRTTSKFVSRVYRDRTFEGFHWTFEISGV